MEYIKSLPPRIRWGLLLPVSIFVYLLIFILAEKLHGFMPLISEPLSACFFQFAAVIVATYSFVWTGATIAPKSNRTVAVYLAVFIIFVNVFFYIVTRMHSAFNLYQELWAVICRVVAVLTSIFAVSEFKAEPKPNISPNNIYNYVSLEQDNFFMHVK